MAGTSSIPSIADQAREENAYQLTKPRMVSLLSMVLRHGASFSALHHRLRHNVEQQHSAPEDHARDSLAQHGRVSLGPTAKPDREPPNGHSQEPLERVCD
jgi:hypothetical protein